MSNALKCPSPSCPYLFDPSQVPAGAVLTCPRCGMRFTLGPPAPPAYPPQAPPTQSFPPGPAPTGAFVPPGYPTHGYPPPQAPGHHPGYAYPPPPPAAPPEPAPPPAAHQRRPAPRRAPAAGGVSGSSTLLLVVVGIALMAGVGLMVYFKFNPVRSRGGGASPGELRERNLVFDPPGAPWAQDDDTRTAIGPPFFLVYKRENPEAYMAFGSRDYDTRMPRPSELSEGLTRLINQRFEEVTTTPIEKGTWLGKPATALEFRARERRGGGTVVGECHAVAAKGFGYWSVCWTVEGDAQDVFPDFDKTRGRFRLLDLRDKWAPREGITKPFGGHRLSYQVLDGEGIWSEPPDQKAEEFDPAGNMYLRAREKRKGRDFPNEAELLVLALDPAGDDPLAQGVKYVKDRRTAEETTPGVKVVFLDRTGPPEGDPANAIDPTAPVARFQEKVEGAQSRNRLRVVSAARIGDKVVVVSAWCAWEDRRLFEDRLTQIAGSLREGP